MKTPLRISPSAARVKRQRCIVPPHTRAQDGSHVLTPPRLALIAHEIFQFVDALPQHVDDRRTTGFLILSQCTDRTTLMAGRSCQHSAEA